METFDFHGRKLHIKRDDLIDEDLSGNKFRKLHFLLDMPSSRYKRLISYGGSQSNAMASIAALCKRKEWEFLYITKALSATLKQNLNGNLKAAIDDGMLLLDVDHSEYREVIQSLYSPNPDSRVQRKEGDLLLAQGGADVGAMEGVKLLAEEIRHWKRAQGIEKLTVVTPSGTGTTAYFLADCLPEVIVCTVPLIGSRAYLEEQMLHLGVTPVNLRILQTAKQYQFATAYGEYLEVYRTFLQQGIEMDLLYAPKMFIALSDILESVEGEILYVHSGGVKGNSSMLERYRHKGFI